jgi:hypothetical protein
MNPGPGPRDKSAGLGIQLAAHAGRPVSRPSGKEQLQVEALPGGAIRIQKSSTLRASRRSFRRCPDPFHSASGRELAAPTTSRRDHNRGQDRLGATRPPSTGWCHWPVLRIAQNELGHSITQRSIRSAIVVPSGHPLPATPKALSFSAFGRRQS